jgi:serine/threonine protein kinase
VFLELARALTAVHAAGFTHGDVHPGNVLIDWFSQVTLIGFGLSRALSDSATRGADAPSAAQDDATNATNATRCSASSMALLFPMTTHAAAYIAPERHLGALGDERADQFSFCAMLYEALWGTRPFAGDNAENALASMCGAPFAAPPAPEIPTAVRRAVRRGLLVDAADRFESMEALCEILASAIAT